MLIPVVSRDPADRCEHYVPLQAIMDSRRHPDGDWQVLTALGWLTADPEVMNALARFSASLSSAPRRHCDHGLGPLPLGDNVVYLSV